MNSCARMGEGILPKLSLEGRPNLPKMSQEGERIPSILYYFSY